MKIKVKIKPPLGLPDPLENIVCFNDRSGNILYAVQELGFDRLDKLLTRDALEALNSLIKELDRGIEGHFTDGWCIEMDTSNTKDVEWNYWGKTTINNVETTSETWWGDIVRSRLREDAMRFFLYMLCGYRVSWKEEED